MKNILDGINGNFNIEEESEFKVIEIETWRNEVGGGEESENHDLKT